MRGLHGSGLHVFFTHGNLFVGSRPRPHTTRSIEAGPAGCTVHRSIPPIGVGVMHDVSIYVHNSGVVFKAITVPSSTMEA